MDDESTLRVGRIKIPNPEKDIMICLERQF